MEGAVSARRSLAKRVITVQLIVDVILWLTVALPVLYLFLRGRPHVQGFFCDDVSLSYPNKPDTISTPLLVATGFAVSIAVIVLVEVFNTIGSKCRRTCRYGICFCLKAYAVFLVGFVVLELFVEVVKNKLGVLRPNFFDVCRPEYNRTVCPGYVTDYSCTQKNEREILKSRQSFPSGHSAFSMYIALFFCIYIQKTLKIGFSCLLKIFMQTFLIFASVVCGIGRIRDNKHHPADVVGGFAIGSCVAVLVLRTLGKKVLKLRSDTGTAAKQVHNPEGSLECCGSYGQSQEIEPQTPAPLLPKDSILFFGDGNTKVSCNKNGRAPSISKSMNNGGRDERV